MAFNFYQPVEVRYSDLDVQWHVNNARFATYLEQARMGYIRHLQLFDSDSFLDFPFILADLHITFRAPIMLRQNIRVGIRVAKLGHKSLTFAYEVQDVDSGQVMASAETVLVAYDYHAGQSMPIPEAWRTQIAGFDGIPLEPTP
jgi:acyl-CoA thioester hydrolase